MTNLAESIGALLMTLLVVVGLVVVIFMACRELFCWYAKINERLELERKRNKRLDEISSHLKILINMELEKKRDRDSDAFVLTEEVRTGTDPC